MVRTVVVGGLAALTTVAFADNVELFRIEKSGNRNQVIYELRNGREVHPYWIMYAERGQTEELTALERGQAFGVNVVGQDSAQIRFTLKALSNFIFTAYTTPPTGHAYVTVRLDGQDHVLKRLYVRHSGSLIPSVKAVYFEGTAVGASGPSYFRLTKDGGVRITRVGCASPWHQGCQE